MSASKLRVMVAVKRVVDYAVRPRVSADKTGVDISHVKMSMNPFCEIATEEAVKMKESGLAGEVMAVSIGPKQSADALRTALAMGCDRALLVETSPPLRGDVDLPHLDVASILSHLVKAHKVDLLLTGKQAIDDDSGLVPSMAAAKMGAAQATCAAKVERGESGGGVRVTREVDGGVQVVELPLPAVISVDLRLNVPRYATLPNIMKAKKKPLEVRPMSAVREEAGVKERERVLVREVREPKERRAGVKVDTVEALVKRLREEAKVI